MSPPMDLQAGLDRMHLALDTEARTQLQRYAALLERWNRAYNLVGRGEASRLIERHLLDSLTVLDACHGQRCLDLGSGAGLPGIPLAIAGGPGCQWTLIDSNGKKTRFLFQAVLELGLEHVRVVQQRFSAFSTAVPYDTIVARAVGPMEALVRESWHLSGAGTRYLFLKGRYPADELAVLSAQVRLIDVVALPVFADTAERHLVILER
ncbi:MAG: 16S rRNA (guanine(527)-N(7))-methyltransferase RsmG [Pseudomonadota bacterium]|nr:16S rRNA (guanine(527)-N(7))-methyltransferase RsmG [Pseudomonadota bacterium]